VGGPGRTASRRVAVPERLFYPSRHPALMALPPMDPTRTRLEELERQVLELRRRLAALEERLAQSREEHPLDRNTVKEKVVYDWQS
jgi:hypothetical protein